MPTILEPKDLPATQKNGANVTALANPATLGTNALEVQRITLKPGSKTDTFGAADVERFVYVIRGTGQAHIGEQKFALEAESVLWLEIEDAFSLEAGVDELEVLLCRAPAGE